MFAHRSLSKARILSRDHLRRHFRCSRCVRSTSRRIRNRRNASLAVSGGSNNTSSKERQRPPRVVVAMSGGVDSSVAAHLLQRENATRADCDDGVDVIGLHMSNWNALDEDSDDGVTTTTNSNENQRRRKSQESVNDDEEKRRRGKFTPSNSTFCEASEKEYNDAVSVARHLSLHLHRVSFASEYWIQVFEPFVESISSPPQSSSDGQEENGENFNRGVTMPNPDFGCNTYIKFGAMKDYAMEKLQADYVATGHYAQLWHRNYASLIDRNAYGSRHTSQLHKHINFYEWMIHTSQALEEDVRKSIAGRPEEDWILNNNTHYSEKAPLNYPMLLAGADRSKDQSYFLSGVKTEAFRNVIFPLGHLAKSHKSMIHQHNSNAQQSVRDIALDATIPTASKRDSMGICFIGKRNFGNFLSQYLPEPSPPGDFVDIDTGEIVGRHNGAMHYTIGQGAKISGAASRYFVCGKGCSSANARGHTPNTVFVCNDTHHPSLYTDELFVNFGSFNWIGLGNNSYSQHDHIPRPLLEGQSIKLFARTRHLQPLASCTVTLERHSDSHLSSKGKLKVQFDKPIRAITPGQIVALYAGSDGLICLGGGPIKGRGASFMDRGILNTSFSDLHPSGHNDLSLARE